MHKNINDHPKRAESLHLYKKPNTIELPRFHSKPKNIGSPYIQEMKKSDTQSNRKSKASQKQQSETNKKRIANIMTKLKFKKKDDYIPRKPVSEKKISNVIHLEGSESTEKIKIGFKSTGVKDKNHKEQEHEKQFESKKQFRSKSLKNAIKLKDQYIDQVKTEQKQVHKKDKKNITEEGRNEKIGRRKKDYITQISTQPTQMNTTIEVDRSVWYKKIQIFHNILVDPGNLDWPQEYIVMEKFTSEKRLYNSMNGTQQNKIKQKIKKHLCITRVTVYLYANMILNQMDCKNLMGLFERTKDSYQIIYAMIYKDRPQLSNKEKLIGINRNNEFNLKTLLTVLSKRKIPHNALLKNMLESCLKIDSFEFIQVLDKTLKWQILKMPSFPYLPSSEKDKHLVLDLDETLVHFDSKLQVFHVRPFAEEFLKKVSKIFQVTIFTAATQQYADQILNEIDPQNCISYKLYRNHLTYLQNVPIKDLSMLGRSMHKTIIVDNIGSNYRLQPNNGIQILSWYHDEQDDVLGKLYALLLKIIGEFESDFREGIKYFSEFIKNQISKEELIYELKNEL